MYSRSYEIDLLITPVKAFRQSSFYTTCPFPHPVLPDSCFIQIKGRHYTQLFYNFYDNQSLLILIKKGEGKWGKNY